MTFRKTGRMLQPAELNRKTGAELGPMVGPDGREVDAGIENTSEL